MVWSIIVMNCIILLQLSFQLNIVSVSPTFLKLFFQIVKKAIFSFSERYSSFVDKVYAGNI